MIVFEINKEASPNKKEVYIKDLKVDQPYLIQGVVENTQLFVEVEKLNIKFEDCTFSKNVFFEIDLSKFKIRNLTISFKYCFIFGGDRTFHHKIETFETYEIHINFFNCILENITFDDLTFSHLRVFNSIIKRNYFLVRGCNIKSIQFYNVLGKYGVNRTRETSINVSFGEDNLYLPSVLIRDEYKQIAQEYKSLFAFPTNILITEPKKLYIEFKLKNESGFKKSHHGFQYRLTEQQINDLNISFIIQTENDTTESIIINNAHLEGIELRNLSKANIEISRCRINKIFIRDLSFDSLKIYDLSSRIASESVFESRNVDFSNSTFDKTDLSSYSIVSFYRSTLNDIQFISPKFPEEIHVLDNIHYPDQKEDNYYRMQSENYRQIKKSLVTSGNQVESLEIHSKMYSSLQKDKNLTIQDRGILFLNKISNNHGTSIFRPFLLFIGLSVIIFFLYRSSLNEAPFNIGFKGLSKWGEGIAANWKFVFEDYRALWLLINPTHKVSTLQMIEPNSNLNSYSLFFSYISRILMAWIIYQFIVSFRKFGRKL